MKDWITKTIEVDVSNLGQYEAALPYEEYYDMLQIEVTYSTDQTIVSNTPFGAQVGTEFKIEEVLGADLFTCDRDGGEASCIETDWEEFLTLEELNAIVESQH